VHIGIQMPSSCASREREREIEKDSRLSPLEIRCFTDSIMNIDRKEKKMRNNITPTMHVV